MANIEDKLRKWYTRLTFRSKQQKSQISSIDRITISMPVEREIESSEIEIIEDQQFQKINKENCGDSNNTKNILNHKYLHPNMRRRICSNGKVSITGESAHLRKSVRATEMDNSTICFEKNIREGRASICMSAETSCMKSCAAHKQTYTKHTSTPDAASTIIEQCPNEELLANLSPSRNINPTDFKSIHDSRYEENETEIFSIRNIDIEAYQSYEGTSGFQNSVSRKSIKPTYNKTFTTPTINSKPTSIVTLVLHSIDPTLQLKDSYEIQLYRTEMLELIKNHKLTLAKQNSEIYHLKKLLAQERKINSFLSTARSPRQNLATPRVTKTPDSVKENLLRTSPKIRRKAFIPLDIEFAPIDAREQEFTFENGLHQFKLLPPFTRSTSPSFMEDDFSDTNLSVTGARYFSSGSSNTICTSVSTVDTKQVL